MSSSSSSCDNSSNILSNLDWVFVFSSFKSTLKELSDEKPFDDFTVENPLKETEENP